MKKQVTKFIIIISFIFKSNIYGQIVIQNSEHAVNIALQNSNDLIIQGLSSLTNMKISKMSFRSFLPSFDFSLSNNQSVSNFATDNKTKTFTLSATQLIYDGGQRSFSYKIGKILSLYAYNEYEQSLKMFSSKIINQYYSLLKQMEIVKIKNVLFSVAKDQLVIVEREKELGLITETNYLEFLISYLETENDREVSVRELERQKDEFKVTLGLNKNIEIELIETYSVSNTYKELIEYKNFLYERIKTQNIDLKKQNLEILSKQAQIKYQKRWFLPTIALEASMSFSGKDYPLTQPDYSIQLSFSFANNPFLPIDIKKKVSIKNGKITSIGDSASTQILPSSTFTLEDMQEKLYLQQSKIKYEQTKNQLYEALLDLVYEHDDYVYEIEMKTKSINLQKKKIEISKVELKNGSLKRVDFLEYLVKLASSEIELLESIINIGMIERNLEILTNIPFGEIQYVCENKK